jgi:23S rRNA (uracil1939-C5)-methyltransferase
MKSLRKFALDAGYSFYDVRKERGFLRFLTMRFGNKGVMAIVGFGEKDAGKIESVMNFLKDAYPQITSFYYAYSPWKDSSRMLEPLVHFAGERWIHYSMENLSFRIGPASFYQTNSDQTIALYETARTFAQLTGEETVYDLYTGTGTIALFVASQSKKVIGIDLSANSIEDARENALLNGIANSYFIAGDLKDTLNEDLFTEQGRPDVIITDPPRSGMHRHGIQRLNASGAKRIVYISCNPVTQIRDLRFLSDKYQLVKSQPVDMFPQTNHVENVVLLEKKNDI